MIDEKKLFEVIKEHSYPITQLDKRIDIGMTLLGIKQAIDEQPKTGEWIPCSEQTPKEGGTYFVTAIENGLRHTTFAKWQSRYKEWELRGARAYWKVIAWQPLPEEYQG